MYNKNKIEKLKSNVSIEGAVINEMEKSNQMSAPSMGSILHNGGGQFVGP